MVLKERITVKVVEGSLKTVIKYAWFPKWVDNKKIWLQKYEETYKYRTRMRVVDLYYSVLVKELPGWDLIETKVL